MKNAMWMLAGILLITAPSTMAKTVPIENFFTHEAYLRPKLSPSGHSMALLSTREQHSDRVFLEIVDTSSLKAINTFGLRRGQTFNYFFWANNAWLVYSPSIYFGGYDYPFSTGRTYSVKAKSGRWYLLDTGTQNIISTLPTKSGYIMAQEQTYNRPEAYRVCVAGVRGLRVGCGQRIAVSPFKNGNLIADNDGKVRLALGYDKKNGKPAWAYRKSDSTRWNILPATLLSPVLGAKPIGFAPDNKRIYLLAYAPSGTLGLYAYNPDSGKKTLIYANPRNDIDTTDFYDGLMYGPRGKHLVAFTLMPGRPQLVILNTHSLAGRLIAAFSATFPNQLVRIVSWSRNGSKAILEVSSDRNPGQYLLVDTKTLQAKLFAQRNPEIDPADMASVKPIKFKARDGLTVHGYLTVPPSAKAHRLPMVVVVHGGPHGARDQWRFNPVVQLFANRGYAVLQINYRGSAGYGKAYAKAGFKHWGTTMQYDVIDATRWALAQDIADPKRICIYGASYGGYAALMSSELAPKLYKCTIGYDGIYDLPLMFHSGDIPQVSFGRRYLHTVLGDNTRRLKDQSPTSHVDRLTGGLFLVQGGADKRAPPAQVGALKDALNRAGKHYKFLYKSNEGHGFYRVEDKRELYGQVLAFIERYIGR